MGEGNEAEKDKSLLNKRYWNSLTNLGKKKV